MTGPRRFSARRCLDCGKKVDSASVVDGEAPQPEPGDAMVCFGCGAPAIVAVDGSFRRPTPEELEELEEDEEFAKTRAFVRFAREMRRRYGEDWSPS